MPNEKNMKRLEDIFKRLGSEVSLSASEKARMTHVLREYIGYKPVRAARPLGNRLISEMSVIAFVMRRRFAPALLIALLFVGGGVSYAAEGALPGDLLYPVKVSVNEELRGAIALSPEAKALWNTRRVERRLEEAVTLVASGEITPEEEATLAMRLETQATEASSAIDELEQNDSNDALSVSSDFDATLAAHGDLLEELGDAIEEVREEARHIATIAHSKVRVFAIAEVKGKRGTKGTDRSDTDHAEENVRIETFSAVPAEEAALRTDVSLSVSAGPTLSLEALSRLATSAKKSLAAAEDLLGRAKDGRSRGQLSADVAATFATELGAIRADYDGAVTLIASGDLEGAYKTLKRVIGHVHRLIVALKTSTRIGVDISLRINDTSGSSDDDDREEVTEGEAQELGARSSSVLTAAQAKLFEKILRNPDIVARAKSHIELALEYQRQGDKLMSMKLYTDAAASFKQAHRLGQGAIVLLSASVEGARVVPVPGGTVQIEVDDNGGVRVESNVKVESRGGTDGSGGSASAESRSVIQGSSNVKIDFKIR